MERLTVKGNNGYQVNDTAAAVNRLGRLEDLYDALLAEKEKITVEMDKLSEAGRTKSATYRQLFANKLNVTNLISRMEIYIE